MSVCEVTYKCDYPGCEEKITVRCDGDFNDSGWERRGFVDARPRYHLCNFHAGVSTERLEGRLELTI
jgi:hypothetical protein